MEKFILPGLSKPQNNDAYNNYEAHKELVAITDKKERLSLTFYQDNDGYPCVGIETKHTARFKYRINNAAFVAIIDYLDKGEFNDLDIDPNNVEVYECENEEDFSTSICKQLIEVGYIAQMVPLFRSLFGYRDILIPMSKGRIYFHLRKSDSLDEFLAEKGLI